MPTVSTVLGPVHVEDKGAADRPTALLWPSLFNDHSMWDHHVAALNAAGWRTLTLDPPGHGLSPGPGRRFTIDECAEVVLQVLDAAEVATKVALVGSSWGGMVAPRVALRAPARVSCMVLFNTTAERPDMPTRLNATLLTLMLRVRALDDVVSRILVTSNFGVESLKRRPHIGSAIDRNLRRWPRPAMIDTVRSVLIDRDATLEALPRVGAPTLVVSGSEDKILPTAMSRRIAGKLGAGRHVEVPGVAHLSPVEAPDASTELMLNFLNQHGR